MPKVVDDSEVFHAIIQEVIDHGYRGATTRQMAEAANINEATLFRKYGSKPELVKKAIGFIVEEFDFSTAAVYTGDVYADLLAVVRAYEATAVRHGQFFFALFSEISRYNELKDSMQKPMLVFLSFSELIRVYQEKGVLKGGSPIHMVAILLTPLMYINSMRNSVDELVVPGIDLETHVQSFLSGYQV